MICNLPEKYKNAKIEDFDNQVIRDFANAFNFNESVLITGTIGVGKTHLSIALINKIDTTPKQILKFGTEYYTIPKKILFQPVSELLTNMAHLSRDDKSGVSKDIYIRNIMNEYDYIILDDFGAHRFTDASKDNFYFVIDKFYRKCYNFILNTFMSIKELEKYDTALMSRLYEVCTIIRLDGVDKRKQKSKVLI